VPLGVYVHIPFCATRCDYCDFATWTDRAHLMDEYVDACVADLDRQMSGESRAATSVFFGGGTPSLLPAAGLSRILAAVRRVEDAEVTVECNPDAVDPAKLGAYAAAGVNRLSFGVQSMARHVLAGLGRTHDPAGVERAVGAARDAGFEHLNLDLIYGTPGESVDDWRRSLDGVLALAPDHVSAYALTVEPGTPLGRAVAAGERPAPDDDDQALKYEIADDVLRGAGFEWYEISNWARTGGECRHNLLYWARDDYLAIGAAAHSHVDGRRAWNLRTPERYIDAVRSGATVEAGHELLDAEARDGESVLLGIRTRAGIPMTPALAPTAASLADDGLVQPSRDRVVLTRRGRLLASEVTVRLLSAASDGGTRVAVGRLEC
jgi:putative oxygen-independent coproporphyrinogen III oxidase